MEKKFVYIAQFESTALDNNERYFESYPFAQIGDAINFAIDEITKQQKDNPGFTGTRISTGGVHDVTVVPTYEGTKWNGKGFDNSTKEGNWRWVRIEYIEIITHYQPKREK